MEEKRLILRTTLGFGVLGAAISLMLPLKYTAISTLMPPQGGPMGASILSQLGSAGGLASAIGGGGGAIGGLSSALKNPNELQVSIMRSATVEDAVIARFGIVQRFKLKHLSQARKQLENIAEIDGDTKDGLIKISVSDKDPKFAADLANGYVEEYKKRTASLALTEASQRRVFFEQQLEQSKNQLANAEEDLKRSEQTSGMIQLDSQARAVIELVARLRAQIAAKEVQIKAMGSFATAENPRMQQAQEELAGLRAELSRLGAQGSSQDEMLIPKGNLQQLGLEYLRKTRDVKYYEAIFQLIARQYEAAKVDEARQGALVQVVDVAAPPDEKSGPKRTLITLGALLAGFLVSIVVVLLRNGLTKLAQDPVEGPRLRTLRSHFLSWR